MKWGEVQAQTNSPVKKDGALAAASGSQRVFHKVVLWITSETASGEIFISMKITELWFKVLWQQQISCK